MTNPTDKPVAAVRLRWCNGGPAVQFPLAIPPGGRGARPVFLPALSVSQTYDIELLPDDEFAARPVGRVSVNIHWPVDLLTKDVFLDPITWQACYRQPPPWSSTTKTKVLFIGVVFTLALAAVLLIRRIGLRFWAWLVVIACSFTTVLVWLFFFNGDMLRKTSLPNGHLVQTRRTGEYRLPSLSPPYAPVYVYQDEIKNETLIVHPEKGSYLALYPGETRIFLKRRVRE